MTQKQRELLDFIERYIESNGRAPTYLEMMRATEVSCKSLIHYRLDSLINRGFIRRIPAHARGLERTEKPLPGGLSRTQLHQELDRLAAELIIAHEEIARLRSIAPQVSTMESEAA
ncbi:hypothetical protein ACFFUB_02490 [Algimonas porphyrae]|uniref:LexA repressor DNA-binding domain-containing protein n=1 Tax=Algimonas porphyrae TaxID=1128113 RepID=A0ABQ5UYJ8_9PROT|nr:hypothetical protein [Algimonas porphyrae]GLQ20373.1 hypothetical protein GCM10007854_13280 [Algimonas porphyrae]